MAINISNRYSSVSHTGHSVINNLITECYQCYHLPVNTNALRNGRHLSLATSLISSTGLALHNECITISIGDIDTEMLTYRKLMYCSDDMLSDKPDNDFN